MWKALQSRRVLKTVRLTTIRNELKRTISTNSGFGMLHIAAQLATTDDL